MATYTQWLKAIGQCRTGRAIRSLMWQNGMGWNEHNWAGEPAAYIVAAMFARQQIGE